MKTKAERGKDIEKYLTGGKHQKSSFELLEGVVDMHCHGFPEIRLDYRNIRDEDDEMVRQCSKTGMRGIMLKANVFSAIRECCYLQKQSPDFNGPSLRALISNSLLLPNYPPASAGNPKILRN